MIFPSLATAFLLQSGIWFALLCAVVGLGGAGFLIRKIIAASPGNARMRQIAAAIEEGAKAYLNRQIRTVSAIALVIAVILVFARDLFTAVGFILGAVCSMAAGYIGMRIAVLSNCRTAQAATDSREGAMRVAFNGGAVTGLLVVGLGLLSVGIFYLIGAGLFGTARAVGSLVGLALGASLISVFARLGGGIYTKAADVGADLVGKIESNLDEDDPRNPATIADNVGDNVGDCAGMAADVFETYAISIIGTILVGFLMMGNSPEAIVYPFLLGGISVIGAIVGILYVNWRKGDPTRVLVEAVGSSALVSAILYWPATMLLFPHSFTIGDVTHGPGQLYLAALVGLCMTGVIVVITNYYTSTAFRPVRKIAQASETGHATNIIAGLAVGQHATALPVIFIAGAIMVSYSAAGLYGIAIAVTSMLSMAGIIISLDAFGPITDNAGGVAVMSELPKSTRNVTDALDAVGNTMKAVTKGYAIASAGLAALVLFGSYVAELRAHFAHMGRADLSSFSFSLERPEIVIGLFIGGLLPFIFTAFSMDAVGKAAGSVVKEVRRQLQAKPGILEGKDTPEYGACVDIVTRAALREMTIPALLPVLFVIVAAMFGYVVLGGLLVGTIVTGLFVAIAMTSGGGAWDNAKKYIEEGHHGGKGSPAHQAAVTGDTVGDPYKDTAGPAINPMIKVANIVAILIIPIVFR
ncbi:MAG: sodium-translocating pyrophosphatase [Verrucomicrobia bacterium]|nr:sodium-translocating pyrophosphatase [Verrucomicrobiota bacterium]MBV9998838.1 sodium-translocating pyrophosphatase [Verrucomicrobiota bacterium]